MYYRTPGRRRPVREFSPIAQTPELDECFADKAVVWTYVLAFTVAVLLALGIHRFLQQLAKQSRTRQGWADAAGWAAAFTPCPSCPGVLDSAGRCNIPGCPLYSPGAAATPVAAQSLLIPELSMEVTPTSIGSGAMATVVYGGGSAEAAGLAPADLIVRFNGRKVRDPAQFQDIVSRARPETSVKIVFLRDGIQNEAQVVIGEGEFTPPPQPVRSAPPVQPVQPVQPAIW